MVQTTFMVDTTGTNADKIPANVPYIGGYVSGLDGVEWSASQWAKFTGRKVRNYQGIGPVPALNSFDEVDVESRAVTPQGAAQIVKLRVDNGIQWTTIYASRDPFAQTVAAIRALGDHYWIGHVNVRLADWSLNLQEATALVGTLIDGASCVGVQWASDSSNPHTLIPGTSLSLSQVGADLSVVDATWIPSGGFGGSAPVPVPSPGPVVPQISHVIVQYADGSEKVVA